MLRPDDISTMCPAGKDIARCPLYIESHVGRGLGCVDDLMRPCRVKRGEMDFQTAVLALAGRGIAHPGMLETLNPIGGCQ
jgi:hypothetical protein